MTTALFPSSASELPRILIVEDEALIAEELQERLKRLGYEVLGHVDSAPDALDAARATLPDLVLMDIRLKGPRDGISAAAELHAELGLPVVYLTAHSDGETLVRARATAPFGYVLKPFHERELLVAIEMALQRHGVERRLRESEARYATTLSSIGDGVIATDPAGQVTFMNSVAESLTGWPLAEALGREIDGVLPLVREDEERPESHPLRQALDSRTVVHCTERLFLLDRQGERIPFEDCAAPIEDPRGRLTGAVMAFRDASERRRIEAALEASRERLHRAERLETLGRLASGVAHDFNNLLTVIQESVELLQHPVGESERPALLESIAGACARGSILTERLLATGRKNQRAPVVLDLNAVVADARLLLTRVLPETIRLAVELAPEPCVLEGDAGLLESVLLNLATNARDAMPDGGTLRVETELVEVRAGHPLVELEGEVPPGQYVRLTVGDTGTGLSAEVRARLFEPFFTTKESGQGTGLGLASVKGVVRQARGHLDVESVWGFGTTFRLYFPALDPARLPRPTTTLRARAERGHERVLLVEDDRTVRAVTRQALELHGYEVRVAGDLAEAREKLRNEPSFALLVTDVGLPDGSGLELAREVLASLPELRVLVLSGYSEASNGLGNAPGLRRLAKPFTVAELTRCVRELLDPRHGS